MPRMKKTENGILWRFLLHFADGRTEETTVRAREFHEAIFGLPRFADVGKFQYELVSKKSM